MTRKDAVWAVWLVGTIGSFAVLETVAFRRSSFPTLSATLSRWLGTYPPAPHGDLAAVAFGAAWMALTLHIARYQPRTERTREPSSR